MEAIRAAFALSVGDIVDQWLRHCQAVLYSVIDELATVAAEIGSTISFHA